MDQYLKQLRQELDKVILSMKEELGAIRTNRPTSKLVEDIKADYFGQKVPVKQLGSIGIVPPREIQVNVWDKAAVGPVAKAIEEANIGVAPGIQGNVVRVSLPPLTEERRKELVKLAGKIAENYRIQVRSLRDNCNKLVKKSEESGGLREDEKFKTQEKIQDLVNEANKNIEMTLENKIKEIRE